MVVTELEHHSNFVPWQYIAKRTGATFKAIPLDEHGELQLDSLEEIARAGIVKVVANNLVSNALGTINPVERLGEWAHEHGAIMVVDAAQAAPHHAIDVQQLGCDFLAFSSHKMCGPTSVGALWGRAELLEAMAPFNLGGHMIRSVKLEETTWGQLPYKFEAGTQPIAEAVGFGAAIDYVSDVGLNAIEQYERELLVYALERLADVPGFVGYGPAPDRRAGIISFNIEGVHPHDVAQVLDMDGVAIRAGVVHLLLEVLGQHATFDCDPELRNERLGHRTCGHDHGSVPRARTLEHIAHVGESMLQGPGEIGMSRPRQRDFRRPLAGRLPLWCPGAHPPLPVLVIPVAHDERERSPERASVAQAGEHLDLVLLELLPGAPAVALLAAAQISVDRTAVEEIGRAHV